MIVQKYKLSYASRKQTFFPRTKFKLWVLSLQCYKFFTVASFTEAYAGLSLACKMKTLSSIIYFLKVLLLRCLRESSISLGFRTFNMVKWMDTLKHEPFFLPLSSDSAADVDDDDRVDKSFLKRLIVSKTKMFSRQIEPLKRKGNEKSNKIKIVINNSNFKFLQDINQKVK